MNILFHIGARKGSKGCVGKNEREFLGKQLSLYTLSAIDLYLKSVEGKFKNIDIVLSTDSDFLIKLWDENKIRKVDTLKRDASLATDEAGKFFVFKDSLKKMEERKNIKYDIFVDLDITSPIRTVEDIKNLVDKKLNTDFDAVFTVTTERRNPYFNQVKQTNDGVRLVFESDGEKVVTRQSAPKIYDINGSVYALSPEFIKKSENLFEGRCDVSFMRDTGVLDLDHETDFETLEVIANMLYTKYPEYGEVRDNIK